MHHIIMIFLDIDPTLRRVLSAYQRNEMVGIEIALFCQNPETLLELAKLAHETHQELVEASKASLINHPQYLHY